MIQRNTAILRKTRSDRILSEIIIHHHLHDIFGEEEVNDFEGFSREELDFNSDIEEYSTVKMNQKTVNHKMKTKYAMLPADWTKTLTALNVLPSQSLDLQTFSLPMDKKLTFSS